ncbi:hypothetical protein MSAN_02086900 [Mycena sanguinolenta]|uniref:Uncharacterized protein n=1 Tax=Mycena sanguinolenta TaxID=230812 RepID=A0A8H6XH94_9AGAR|nr:hypothetical protein MSAN_02086900 [Mycena sanguinolenta]
MEFLPQELVQAIVHEIDDIPSLKACALAGPMFRGASQRVLLSSLTLRRRNAKTAYARFIESPHIAAYITRLRIWLEPIAVDGDNLPQSSNLQPILDKLMNVRECAMTLNSPLRRISNFFFDFLARQPLRKMIVTRSIALSDSILGLLAIAPVICFADVVMIENDYSVLASGDPDPGPLLLDNNLQYTPRVEELIFDDVVDPIFYERLAHPKIKLGSTLRRLSLMQAEYAVVHSPQFMSVVAPTLEHLCLGGVADFFALPMLPSLCSIGFHSFHHWNLWLPNVILDVARTSPLLVDIAVSFLYSLPLVPNEVLTILDVALAAHPKHPVLRWRVDLRSAPGNESGDATVFAQFASGIQTAMPRTNEEGRVVLEKYDYDQEFGQLSGNPRYLV